MAAHGRPWRMADICSRGAFGSYALIQVIQAASLLSRKADIRFIDKLQQGWPLLANVLADKPSLVALWIDPTMTASLRDLLPEPLRGLAEDPAIASTIGAPGAPGALDEALLSKMIC